MMPEKYSYFNNLSEIIACNGFTVTPTKGKTPAVRNWQNPKPTDPQWLARVVKANRFAGCNVGIVCGRVVGIDLDADDPEKALQLESLAAENLGPTMFQRIGRAPRTLLLYRPGEGERIPSLAGIGGCVDVLSGGRQFVAFGIHPDTGQPYQWIADNPHTKRIEDVPTITAAELQSFTEEVARAFAGPSISAAVRAASAAMTARHRARQGNMLGGDDGIVRDASGRVIDGREKFMRNITATEYARDKNTTPDNLANRVWARFIAEADLARPKGSNPRQRWQRKDALTKARSICRRRPDLKAPRRSRGGHPASNLHAWRKAGFWTPTQRELHLAHLGQRINTPVVLAVARVMIEAVEFATGFCTLSIAEIAKRASCSTKSVSKARTRLTDAGFWIGHGGVFVPQALNNNQVVERKGRKSVGGNTKVPPLYHLSLVSPSFPAALGGPGGASAAPVVSPSMPYQPDMLGAPVVDLNQYRRGRLPPDFAALVRAEMRARGVTQDELAAEIGLSQPQLANALAGRFGLSPEPAARLLAWLRRAA